jgi:GNAT superfamily N-acetyltransferase
VIKIELLKNYPHAISAISRIWYEVLGKIWMPEIGVQEIEAGYYEEFNHDIMISYVALYEEIPVGSCTLQLNDGIRPDLGPWISDLLVDSKYQRQGIGKALLNAASMKAKDLGFRTLYLFAFDDSTAEYYHQLGWEKIGIDKFKSHPVIVMGLKL